MQYSLKLTVNSVLLCIGALELMHFNDLHLLFVSFTDLWTEVYFYGYIGKILWEVMTSRSYISKTIHPNFMKLTGFN